MSSELHDLKRRAISSALWTLARIGSDQGFSFGIFVLLARLLDPHAMGVFALALAISELGKLIASAGFPDAVIREPELDAELADGIFWANFMFGLAVLMVLVGLSWPIASFFREPELQPVVCVCLLCWCPTLHSAVFIRRALCEILVTAQLRCVR